MPTYVGENVVGNMRKVKEKRYTFLMLNFKLTYFQQPLSALLKNNGDGTYDAYEKDIAIASFYFDEPIAYEYTRQVQVCA